MARLRRTTLRGPAADAVPLSPLGLTPLEVERVVNDVALYTLGRVGQLAGTSDARKLLALVAVCRAVNLKLETWLRMLEMLPMEHGTHG